MNIGTIGLIAALALVGVAALPGAQAVGDLSNADELIEVQAPCVSVYQEYPDGSRFWILYRTCVGS